MRRGDQAWLLEAMADPTFPVDVRLGLAATCSDLELDPRFEELRARLAEDYRSES
jgi:hypothetical protein